MTTYCPLKRGSDGQPIRVQDRDGYEKGEEYSFSISEFQKEGCTEPFCHPAKMHKTFAALQKGARIMHLCEGQWKHMVVDQIVSKWDETRKLELHDNKEDGYCVVTYSQSEYEYIVQEFFYKFRCKDKITTMSFKDVARNVEADQMRPLVSTQASLPAVWDGSRWEKTSDLPHPLDDETKNTLTSFVKKLKHSSAYVTVNYFPKNFSYCET